MSKNKYILPFKNAWFVEYGGTHKSNSHSWNIIPQRYAYDFEVRKNGLPYHNDQTKCENYYSYLEEIICPCDGFVINIKNEYEDTHITEDRKVVSDVNDPRGNFITISHEAGEYSTICHIKKDSFQVDTGDIVKQGQVLAFVGNSGNTQGPHIHFQVQKGDDFLMSPGIKISFKDTYNKTKKIKYIEKGMEVYTKQE